MRRLKKGKKNPFLKKIIILSFVPISIILIIILFNSTFFKIHLIDINLIDILCADKKNIEENLSIFDRNIFLLDEKNITKNLKNKFICIKSTNLTKNYPNKIKLDVIGRKAVAQVIFVDNFEASTSSIIENSATPAASLADEPSLIDDEGTVFSKGIIENLPKIYIFNKKLSIGGDLNEDFLTKTLLVQKFLKDFSLNNFMVIIFNNLLIVEYLPKIVFRLDADINSQLASLQLILQKAKIDESRLEFIDLRFDKPIVKFAPKKS